MLGLIVVCGLSRYVRCVLLVALRARRMLALLTHGVVCCLLVAVCCVLNVVCGLLLCDCCEVWCDVL